MALLNNDKKVNKNSNIDLSGQSDNKMKPDILKVPKKKVGPKKVEKKLPLAKAGSDLKIAENKEKAQSLPKPKSIPAFSLLPIDEDQILYNDLPNALKKILYVFIAWAILALGLWYLASNYLFKEITVANDLQNQIIQTKSEALKYNIGDSEIKLMYDYYKILNNLLDNHITWFKFFAFLETFTVPEVRYTDFSVTASKETKVSFSAVAKNLASALKQYKVLKEYAKDYCNDVEITNIHFLDTDENSQERSVGFNISFSLDENIFYNKNIIKK